MKVLIRGENASGPNICGLAPIVADLTSCGYDQRRTGGQIPGAESLLPEDGVGPIGGEGEI